MVNTNNSVIDKYKKGLLIIQVLISTLVSAASFEFWWIRDDYAHLARVLSPVFIPGADFQFFRPVFDMIFWLGAESPEGLPLGARLISACIYLALTLSVSHFAISIGMSRFAALIASLLVASHPLTYETTVWICAMSGPLTEALGLVALGLVCSSKHEKNNALRWGMACVLLFVGLMTKESMLSYILLVSIVMIAKLVRKQAPPKALIFLTAVIFPAAIYTSFGFTKALESSLYKIGEIKFSLIDSLSLWGSYLAAVVFPITEKGMVPNLVDWHLPMSVGLALGAGLIAATLYFKPKNWKLLLLWLAIAPLPYLFFHWGVISRYSITMVIPISLLLATPLSKVKRNSKLIPVIYGIFMIALISFGLYSRWESPAVKGWRLEGEVSRYIQQSILQEKEDSIKTIGYYGFPFHMGWGDTSEQIRDIAAYTHPRHSYQIQQFSEFPGCPAPSGTLLFFYRDGHFQKCTPDKQNK